MSVRCKEYSCKMQQYHSRHKESSYIFEETISQGDKEEISSKSQEK